MNFWHKLFNPHCLHCTKCESCETLRGQLERSNYEKEQMLKYILEPQPVLRNETVSSPAEEDEPIRPKSIPWNVRREMLESEDRERARILRISKDNTLKAVEELEKNLGIVQNTSLDLGDEDVSSKAVQSGS